MADRLLVLVAQARAMAKFLAGLWEPWMSDGLCRQGNGNRGVRSEDFFPAPNDAPNSLRVRRARRLCVQCPVRQECLEWSFASRASISDGVYGGITPRERKAVMHLPPTERFRLLNLWLQAQMTGRFAVAAPDEWRANGNGIGTEPGTSTGPDASAATAV